MKKILAMACMVALGAGMASAQTVSLGSAIRDVATELSPGIERGTSVAVIAVQADSVGMSDHLINGLIAALFDMRGAHGFEVVSRSHIELLMAEQNLSMSGLVDDASAVSIGRFAGAQYIITGAFSPFGDSYRFTAQMIEVETAFFRGISTADVQNDNTVSALLGAAGRVPPRPPRPRSVNWLSAEATWGTGVRYERDLNTLFSVGGVAFSNIWGDFVANGILATARFFPLNLTGLYAFPVFFELGMGFGSADGRSYHDQWEAFYRHFGYYNAVGFMVNPAIGVRLGGRRWGFFITPFASFPFVVGQTRWWDSRVEADTGTNLSGFHFRFGAGLGWAW